MVQLLRVPVLHAHVLFLLLVMCVSSHPHLLLTDLTFSQVREHNRQVHDDVTVISMKGLRQQKWNCGKWRATLLLCILVILLLLAPGAR